MVGDDLLGLTAEADDLGLHRVDGILGKALFQERKPGKNFKRHVVVQGHVDGAVDCGQNLDYKKLTGGPGVLIVSDAGKQLVQKFLQFRPAPRLDELIQGIDRVLNVFKPPYVPRLDVGDELDSGAPGRNIVHGRQRLRIGGAADGNLGKFPAYADPRFKPENPLGTLCDFRHQDMNVFSGISPDG